MGTESTVLVSPEQFIAARNRLVGTIRETPTTLSHSLSQRFGRDVYLKREFMQRTGSFKLRGAFNRLSQLPSGAAIVAASAGNHAQGVALAARLLNQTATIFMPMSASLPKLVATRSYGAHVIQEGVTTDDSIVAAQRFSGESGAIFISPFDHEDVIAGQGTIGLEILEQCPEAQTVVVAIGGGGLCGGIAAAIKQQRPDISVVGVTAAGAPAMIDSLAAGHPVAKRPATIADGIAIGSPSVMTLRHVETYVDDVVTVTDEEISEAVLLLVERAKAVVEPAGAASLAAIASGRIEGTGPVVAVLGGGNVDPLLLSRLIQHGMSLSNRYLVMTVTMPDRPGSLSALTAQVAQMGLNVIEVVHQRAGRPLGFGEVSIELTVETRNLEHQETVISALRDAGFGVVSAPGSSALDR